MFQPLHTGAMGLTGQQKKIDAIGNNLANVGTQGFRRSRVDFQDNLYTRMWNFVDNSPQQNLQRGTGVHMSQNVRMFDQGNLEETGRPLDFALIGPGFFVLENPFPAENEDGEELLLYSRVGTFHLSPDPDDPAAPWFLVDPQGRFVLDDIGDRIRIPDPDSLTVDQQGRLFSLNEFGEMEEITRLWLVNFTNPGGLYAVGGSYFTFSGNEGEKMDIEGNVRQHFKEGSNVDLSEEMTRMIRAQRAFQLAARTVSTADQMMQIANNIRS